jgi:hypothetical protein
MKRAGKMLFDGHARRQAEAGDVVVLGILIDTQVLLRVFNEERFGSRRSN